MEPPSEGTLSSKLEFHCNFARLPLITKEIHDIICTHDQKLRERLPREFLDYYVTALLWARLLHLKRHSSRPLTVVENEYLCKFDGKSLPVPEPIHNILAMIGNIRDFPRGTGGHLYLGDHTLPVAVAAGKGGYHAERITISSHNLFEELPSLGVSGDCIMCLTHPRFSPEPLFPFLPFGVEATPNLVGYFGPSGRIAEELGRILTLSLSISAYGFKEDVAGTRLNVGLVDHASKIIQQCRAFRLMSFCIDHMSLDGSEAQVIQTFPVAQTWPMHQAQDSSGLAWTQRSVQPQKTPYFNRKCVEASYFTGFQLCKEEFEGGHSNWCCVKVRDSFIPWVLTPEFIANRNLRRYPIRKLWETLGEREDARSQSEATREYCSLYDHLDDLAENLSFMEL